MLFSALTSGLLACATANATPATLPTAPSATAPAAPAEDPAMTQLRAAMELDLAGDASGARAALDAIAAANPDTRVGAFAARRAAELAVVGTPATKPDAERWYTPVEVDPNASATVIVFFESWCPHCQQELPRLPDLACRWRPAGVQVVALTKLTQGATDADVQRDIVQHGLLGIAVGHERATATSEGTTSDAYRVTGIPAAAVIKDGTVLWRGHPAQLDDAALAKLTGATASTAPCAPASTFGR